jgi:hypothetical protein
MIETIFVAFQQQKCSGVSGGLQQSPHVKLLKHYEMVPMQGSELEQR